MKSPAGKTETGVVRVFLLNRRYGFITLDEARHDGCRDVFFHRGTTAPGVDPTRGDRVSFTIGRSRDGRPRAEDVRILNDG
jgi:cold shock CspA family protein